MKTNWIDINERLPEELKNVLVTINYDDELHLAYLKDGKWKIWIDDELVLNGDAWIDNTLDQKGFGVIAWMELPKRGMTKVSEKDKQPCTIAGVTDRFLIRSKYCGTLVSDEVMSKKEADSLIEYYNLEAKKLESDVRYESVHENDL